MGVVCDDAEAGVGGVLFHDAAQGHLRRGRHGVGLVEDDELEGREGGAVARLGPRGEDLSGGGEGLDLLADDVDASVVGCVQLQDHLAHVFDAIYAAGEGEDGGGFAGAGGAVEEEVRQPLGQSA